MPRPPLSVQLYSVRDALEANPAETLGSLAQLGFRDVEPFSLADLGPTLAPHLAAAGLRAPTSHAQLVGTDPAPPLKAAADLGVELLIEPAVPAERWADRESIAAVVAELAEVAENAADLGIRVGYHNHWWELESRIDGTPALEVFADLLPETIALEVDTYWVAVGGVDPVALLQRLGDRVAAIHVKDGSISRDTLEQLPAGGGRMPVAEILAAAPNARPVLEFDDYAGDVFEGLGAAFTFVRSLGIQA